MHILITRSGPKSRSGVCDSVDGDDYPWMERRSQIAKRRSVICAEIGASYVGYISQHLAA